MRLFLISTLLLSQVSLYAQKDLQIPLKPVPDYGRFTPEELILAPLENVPTLTGIPAEVTSYRIRQIDFQSYNTYYAAIVNKGENPKGFSSGIEFVQLLTGQPYHHATYVLRGFNKKGEHIVILDTNHNLFFSDDKVYRYPGFNNREDEKAALEKLPHIAISLPYFNGTKVENRPVKLRFNPYRAYVTMNFKDSTENPFYLTVSIPQHREGEFKANGKHYSVALSNGFRTVEYNKKRLALLIWAKEDSIKKQPPYGLGDDVYIGDDHYKFTSAAMMGDTLHLQYIGNSNTHTGFTEGQYPPAMHASLLDGTPFSLEAYKGKYVLLDFWGTWCAPCIKVIPDIKRLNERFMNKSFVMVSVANDDAVEKVQAFVKKQQMKWTQVYQNDRIPTQSDMLTKLKISSYPQLILIDPTGKIISRNKSIAEVEMLLSRHL